MFVTVLLFSMLAIVVVTPCACFTLWYYRRRLEQREMKAAFAIGAAFGLLMPALCFERLLPGRPGELVATGALVFIFVACVVVVRRILAVCG